MEITEQQTATTVIQKTNQRHTLLSLVYFAMACARSYLGLQSVHPCLVILVVLAALLNLGLLGSQGLPSLPEAQACPDQEDLGSLFLPLHLPYLYSTETKILIADSTTKIFTYRGKKIRGADHNNVAITVF